jgi:hypothetical protein
MSLRLDQSLQIRTLAQDLGLHYSDKPTKRIVESVDGRVKQIKKKFGCKTLRELLDAVAAEVGTVFREIHSDSELEQLSVEYADSGELIFANLANDLDRPDDYGITISLQKPKPWERCFVSVIDCRGDKSYRTYFTKWHELAHLLTLTAQRRLVFRRSHSRENSADPEEKLMDIIASETGFLAELLPTSSDGVLTFEAINEIKREFCPEASQVSAMIGIVKAFPSPCVLIEAKLGYKKSEKSDQLGFSFKETPVPSLRAVHATVNGSARDLGVRFFPNWRVPLTSVVAKVFNQGGYEEQDENLDWWTASGGKSLGSLPVRVKARKRGNSVQALILPDPDHSF